MQLMNLITPSHMLPFNKNIWNSALPTEFSQFSLDIGAIGEEVEVEVVEGKVQGSEQVLGFSAITGMRVCVV